MQPIMTLNQLHFEGTKSDVIRGNELQEDGNMYSNAVAKRE